MPDGLAHVFSVALMAFTDVMYLAQQRRSRAGACSAAHPTAASRWTPRRSNCEAAGGSFSGVEIERLYQAAFVVVVVAPGAFYAQVRVCTQSDCGSHSTLLSSSACRLSLQAEQAPQLSDKLSMGGIQTGGSAPLLR